MQVILSVPLTLAVAVLGLFVILIRLTSRGEEGNPLDELKLKKKKKSLKDMHIWLVSASVEH